MLSITRLGSFETTKIPYYAFQQHYDNFTTHNVNTLIIITYLHKLFREYYLTKFLRFEI